MILLKNFKSSFLLLIFFAISPFITKCSNTKSDFLSFKNMVVIGGGLTVGFFLLRSFLRNDDGDDNNHNDRKNKNGTNQQNCSEKSNFFYEKTKSFFQQGPGDMSSLIKYEKINISSENLISPKNVDATKIDAQEIKDLLYQQTNNFTRGAFKEYSDTATYNIQNIIKNINIKSNPKIQIACCKNNSSHECKNSKFLGYYCYTIKQEFLQKMLMPENIFYTTSLSSVEEIKQFFEKSTQETAQPVVLVTKNQPIVVQYYTTNDDYAKWISLNKKENSINLIDLSDNKKNLFTIFHATGSDTSDSKGSKDMYTAIFYAAKQSNTPIIMLPATGLGSFAPGNGEKKNKEYYASFLKAKKESEEFLNTTFIVVYTNPYWDRLHHQDKDTDKNIISGASLDRASLDGASLDLVFLASIINEQYPGKVGIVNASTSKNIYGVGPCCQGGGFEGYIRAVFPFHIFLGNKNRIQDRNGGLPISLYYYPK